MFYKIVGVSDQCPDQPSVYRGEFSPVPGEHPALTALVHQFGRPGEPAASCLNQWSGGEVSHWIDDLDFSGPDDDFMCLVGDITFHVTLRPNADTDWLAVSDLIERMCNFTRDEGIAFEAYETLANGGHKCRAFKPEKGDIVAVDSTIAVFELVEDGQTPECEPLFRLTLDPEENDYVFVSGHAPVVIHIILGEVGYDREYERMPG